MKLEDVLILLGLLGCIYGIVLFIRSFFKKTQKKPGILIFIGSFLIMLSGGALMNTYEEKEKNSRTTFSQESTTFSESTYNEPVSSEPTSDNNISREFTNALESAKNYLKFTNLSKEGLYNQLIFDKYPEEAAKYATETIQADWKEHAIGSANNYLTYSAFSQESLSSQLTFDNYTEDEIRYALENIEVNWEEQALQSARQLQSFTPLSNQALFDQLIFSGFTEEQADYALKNLSE